MNRMISRLAALLVTSVATLLAQQPDTFIRENYTKFEHRIPMRDGLKLLVAVYVPKDVFSEGRSYYPVMMMRTPY